jgi:ATP-dependent DNA helicase RecG
MRSGGRLQARLIGQVPFALTAAQQRVLGEIETDLTADRPMLRLLQGDVGSGKTIVAALAAARVLEAGWQVALMAPTELLAEQHHQNLCDWFAPLEIKPLLLTGRSRSAARRSITARMDTDTSTIVVGTHALFQEDVRFARLGFVIIDEQHRFGVHQRLRLLDKGGDLCPHQLIMTATPIPRTLAMAMHADLDVSTIDALPPGRTPVTTAVMPETRRDELIERIRNACRTGRQVYWVCPLIEESEILECQAAAETAEELGQRLKPDIRVGLVHGRMPARAKHAAMHEFKAGRLQVLVATTVIEVGMDIPGASLMIIENAERLGLAQLHQLRGRVGRGSGHSDCILLYRAPLSDLARRRLEAMRKTSDGFVIAERDLELRGPGELLGTRQTGLPQMRIADLARDSHLIARLKPAGDLMLRDCPENIEPLIARWRGQWLDYGIV